MQNLGLSNLSRCTIEVSLKLNAKFRLLLFLVILWFRLITVLRTKNFEKKKVLVYSNLIYLVVASDLLKIWACKLHLQLILLVTPTI